MNKSEKVLSNKLGKKLNEAMIFSFEPSAIFLTKVLVLSSSLANFVRIVNITRSKNGCKWTSISFQLIEFVCFLRPRPISWKKKMETELASLVVTLYRKLSLSLHLPFSFSMIFVSEPTITASVSARFHRSRLRCTAGSPSFAFPRWQIC